MKEATGRHASAWYDVKLFTNNLIAFAILLTCSSSCFAAGPPENKDTLSRLLLRGTINSLQDPLINAETNVLDWSTSSSRSKHTLKPASNVEVKVPVADGLVPIKPLPKLNTGIHWNNVVRESLYFLAIEHAFRFATERGTRAELKGPFFADWFASVRNMRGWRDGDPFMVNYIGHPLQGTVSGYILVQNDPNGYRQTIVNGKPYWMSRFKAFGWNLAYSTQFEVGPLSESSLGNVGRLPTHTSRHPQAWVDMVITPTVGTAWLVGEDALDHFLIKRLENRFTSPAGRMFIRSFLNPGRSFANMLRGKWFWHRDDRPGVSHY